MLNIVTTIALLVMYHTMYLHRINLQYIFVPDPPAISAGMEKLADLEVRERQAAEEGEKLRVEAARLSQEGVVLQDSRDAAAREQQESHAAVQVRNKRCSTWNSGIYWLTVCRTRNTPWIIGVCYAELSQSSDEISKVLVSIFLNPSSLDSSQTM